MDTMPSQPLTSSDDALMPWQRLAGAAGLLDPAGRLSSTIFEEMSFLAARHEAINLGQGFPDVDGPEALREAAARAVLEGPNQYATIAGDPGLREEIARQEEASGRRRPDPATEVTVTAGATEALAASMLAFLSPGDEVVLLEPFYDLYPAIAALAGATVRTVPLRPPHFRPDPEQMRAAFSPATCMVVINDPHNPTGTMLRESDAAQLVGLAVEHDALILTDSVYEHLWYDGAPVDPAGLPGAAERTIRVSAISKTFAATGWRVGWAIAPAELMRGVRATKGYLSHSAAAPLQRAAAQAMAWAREQDYYAPFRRDHVLRRDLLREGLERTSLTASVPEGTFFAVARLEDGDAAQTGRPEGDAEAAPGADPGRVFAEDLPARAGVGVVPLSAFATPENRELYAPWVRFAFCKRPEVLTEAIRRLVDAGI